MIRKLVLLLAFTLIFLSYSLVKAHASGISMIPNSMSSEEYNLLWSQACQQLGGIAEIKRKGDEGLSAGALGGNICIMHEEQDTPSSLRIVDEMVDYMIKNHVNVVPEDVLKSLSLAEKKKENEMPKNIVEVRP